MKHSVYCYVSFTVSRQLRARRRGSGTTLCSILLRVGLCTILSPPIATHREFVWKYVANQKQLQHSEQHSFREAQCNVFK